MGQGNIWDQWKPKRLCSRKVILFTLQPNGVSSYLTEQALEYHEMFFGLSDLFDL